MGLRIKGKSQFPCPNESSASQMKPKKAAAFLGISVHTLAKDRRKNNPHGNRIPYVYHNDRVIRYRLEDLVEYLRGELRLPTTKTNNQ